MQDNRVQLISNPDPCEQDARDTRMELLQSSNSNCLNVFPRP